MSDRVYLIAAGEYDDYHIIAVALSEAEAQEYVDAYNAVKSHRYEDAYIEDAPLYRTSAPLPRKVALYSYGSEGPGMTTNLVTDPNVIREPGILRFSSGRIRAVRYPTPEAAEAAYREAIK